MRKFVIAVVLILGTGMLVAPYFVGQAANKSFINHTSMPWLYVWTLGFIICGCLAAALFFIGMLWPISTDIADWAEKKFK